MVLKWRLKTFYVFLCCYKINKMVYLKKHQNSILRKYITDSWGLLFFSRIERQHSNLFTPQKDILFYINVINLRSMCYPFIKQSSHDTSSYSYFEDNKND